MSEADRLLAMNRHQPFGPGFFIFLGILSVVIGVTFVVAGIRLRRLWLAFWGSGLALAGIGLVLFALFFQR
jgi:hypothetical protein